MNEIPETSDVLSNILEYIKHVEEFTLSNSDMILSLEEFTQSVASYAMGVGQIVGEISDSVKGIAVMINDRIDLLELSQDATMEAVNNLATLTKLGVFLGIWNTGIIVTIIGFLIINRRK